jgi:hypothetical protein
VVLFQVLTRHSPGETNYVQQAFLPKIEPETPRIKRIGCMPFDINIHILCVELVSKMLSI